MTLLSEIYDVTLKRGNRGASAQSWIRPTIGEFFVTHMDFQKIKNTVRNLKVSILDTTSIENTSFGNIHTINLSINIIDNSSIDTVLINI